MDGPVDGLGEVAEGTALGWVAELEAATPLVLADLAALLRSHTRRSVQGTADPHAVSDAQLQGAVAEARGLRQARMAGQTRAHEG